MPTRAEHEEKAQAIEQLLPLFDVGQVTHADWIAVISFYAALHWLDAYFVQQRLHTSNHRERNRAAHHLPIWGEYHELYVVSRIARYEAGHLPSGMALKMRDPNLVAIHTWAERSTPP